MLTLNGKLFKKAKLIPHSRLNISSMIPISYLKNTLYYEIDYQRAGKYDSTQG
jgi:hypothetical protein